MSQINRDLLRDGVAYVDQWMAYQQERREIPGVVVAIRHEDQFLLSQGYGYADLERAIPMTPRHVFRIASHSKTFTATAIMQLVERNKLRLDDQLAAYIPWLGQRDTLARVTIRQVLNHAAGIVRDGADADYWRLEGAFPDATELRRLVEEGGAVLDANESFKYCIGQEHVAQRKDLRHESQAPAFRSGERCRGRRATPAARLPLDPDG